MKLTYEYQELSIKYKDANEMQLDKKYMLSIGWRISLEVGLNITYCFYDAKKNCNE